MSQLLFSDGSPLKVCMLTSGHPGNDARIYFKEARTIAKFGAEVTIVCCDLNGVPDESDGVKFVTFPVRRKWIERVLATRNLVGIVKLGRYDVIHVHEPDALMAALRVRRETGAKIIYDSHEVWGATFAQRFHRALWRPACWLFQKFEGRLISRCDAAIGASWAISKYLRRFLPDDRVETILNVPVPEVFGDSPEWYWGEETVLCHEGVVNFGRGLVTMLEAVHIVSHHHKVKLRIVGDINRNSGNERKWVEEFMARQDVKPFLEVTGWLPYSEVGRHIASCHIGLSVLQLEPNNIGTSSNKVFNYMLYGLPFVGPDFRLSKIKLAEEGLGVLADSASPKSYAAAITDMIENREQTMEMRRRALHASETKYRWEHMEPKLLRLYKELMVDMLKS